MGMYARARVFYGAAWDPEVYPEFLRDELGCLKDEYGDAYDAMGEALEELGVSDFFEVENHGYEYGGYAVAARHTMIWGSAGDVETLHDHSVVSDEIKAMLDKILDRFGREGATVGWLLTVSYG